MLQMKPNIVGFLALADFIWRAALLLKKMLLPLAVCPRFPVLDGVAHDAHLELVGVSRWDRVLRMYTNSSPNSVAMSAHAITNEIPCHRLPAKEV